MKCIQISMGGDVICSAGHEKMSYIVASLYLMADEKSYRFIVSGKNDPLQNFTQLLRYLDISLLEGQPLELKVVDIEAPDVPDRISSFGTHKVFGSNTEEHFCSFCGKNKKDVEKMLIGISGNICNFCYKNHSKMFE